MDIDISDRRIVRSTAYGLRSTVYGLRNNPEPVRRAFLLVTLFERDLEHVFALRKRCKREIRDDHPNLIGSTLAQRNRQGQRLSITSKQTCGHSALGRQARHFESQTLGTPETR